MTFRVVYYKLAETIIFLYLHWIAVLCHYKIFWFQGRYIFKIYTLVPNWRSLKDFILLEKSIKNGSKFQIPKFSFYESDFYEQFRAASVGLTEPCTRLNSVSKDTIFNNRLSFHGNYELSGADLGEWGNRFTCSLEFSLDPRLQIFYIVFFFNIF